MTARVAPYRFEAAQQKGLSRQTYSRFALVECPPLARGLAYFLVARHGPVPQIAAAGRTRHAHGPLNLADVRRTGALLNAWEVWVLDAETPVATQCHDEGSRRSVAPVFVT